MIWKSKDGKQALDLSKVAYWKYVPKEDWASINQQNKKSNADVWEQVYEERNTLEIYFGGDGPLTFSGETAEEIYNMLISQPEVI